MGDIPFTYKFGWI